jgi:hypothetical protein
MMAEERRAGWAPENTVKTVTQITVALRFVENYCPAMRKAKTWLTVFSQPKRFDE